VSTGNVGENMKLSKLQQELFDLMVKAIEEDFQCYTDCDSPEELESWFEDLAKDISSMNAIDLRQNIKVWKEDISFGRRK
jgi:hypothetical protein